jgi:predicted ATPase/class 3 adenylate cyclase
VGTTLAGEPVEVVCLNGPVEILHAGVLVATHAQRQRPVPYRFRMGGLPAGLVTFVFTDIEGSTALFGRLGDSYYDVLEDHSRLLRDAFTRHGGVEVKTEGDAFFVAFSTAAGAVSACVDAQLALASHPWTNGEVVRVRIGVHTGLAEPVAGDYIALAVNQAARITAAGHGGQILVSSETMTAASDCDNYSFERLGAFRFKGFDQPEPVYQVTHPKLASLFPPLRAPAVLRSNFHRLAIAPVGRDDTIVHLSGMLRANRLVTVVGPGGVGKSTVALAAAERVAGTFAGGAWLVELGNIEGDTLVADAIASALGLLSGSRERAEDLLEQRLAVEPTLLVLDGAERATGALARLLDHLLPRCPALSAVVATRVPLGLTEEQVIDLPPLPVPPASTTLGLDELRHNPAVALLRERWTAAADDELSEPDAEELELLGGICRRLDGIPLAIELAGAALAVASPAEVLGGLWAESTEGDEAIVGPLRASLGWSYALLDEQQRFCFRRLGAFAGHPTLEAAAAVCGGSGQGRAAELLISLADRSLVQLRRAGGRVRVHLLDTVRHFAYEQLESAGEAVSSADRHLDWYSSSIEGVVEQILAPQPDRGGLLDAAEPDVDDLRRALAYAGRIRAGTAAQHLGLAAATACQRQHRLEQARLCLEAALAASDETSAARARMLIDLGWNYLRYDQLRPDLAQEARQTAAAVGARELESIALSFSSELAQYEGRLDEADALANEALALAADSPLALLSAYQTMGLNAQKRGDYQRHRDVFGKVVEVARRPDTPDRSAVVCKALLNLANAEHHVGNVDEADAAIAEAIDLADPHGPIYAHLLAMHAFFRLSRGAVSDAWELVGRAETAAREFGMPRLTAFVLNNVAEIADARGDRTGALDWYRQAMSIAMAIADVERVAYCLHGLAIIATRVGDDVDAVAAFGALDRLCREGTFRFPDDYLRAGENTLATLRERLGPAPFATAWQRGQSLDAERAAAELTPNISAAIAEAPVQRID